MLNAGKDLAEVTQSLEVREGSLLKWLSLLDEYTLMGLPWPSSLAYDAIPSHEGVDQMMNQSSAIYYISPQHLRELRVELLQRNRDNAYRSHPLLKRATDTDRAQAWDKLKCSISKRGFSPEHPILIHLNRKNGEDKISKDGGHHRLAIAIELGLAKIPVRFVYEVREKTVDDKQILFEEWKEIRQSLRYFGNKRFAQLTVFIAASGFLFDAYLKQQSGARFQIPIALVGLVGSQLFFLMERSSVAYWYKFADRARAIEGLLPTLELMSKWRPPERLLSGTNAVYAIYFGVAALWVLALLAIWL